MDYLKLCVVLTLISGAQGLWCYSCSATGRDNRCEQYSTYQTAALVLNNNNTGILKECVPPYDKICFIETYTSQGITHSHIRDCGDGKTFSFDNNTVFDRLHTLGENNETACVWQGTYQVCLSKCNQNTAGMLCNGPSVKELLVFNSAPFTGAATSSFISCLLLHVIGYNLYVNV